MGEFTFTAEKPFELGIQVPFKNTRMTAIDRFAKITDLAENVLATTIEVEDDVVTKHFLARNNAIFPDIIFDNEEVKTIILGPSTRQDFKGIIIELPGSRAGTNNLIKFEIAGNALEIKSEFTNNFDKVNIHTIPHNWDNLDVLTHLTSTNQNCAYAIIPSDIEVLGHANAAVIIGGANPALGGNADDCKIVSDISEKSTTLVEFLSFRFSVYYRFTTNNISQSTLKSFIKLRSKNNDDFFSSGNLDLRKKTFDIQPISDGEQRFWEESFSLFEDMDFWENEKLSDTTDSNAGSIVTDASVDFIVSGIVNNDRIALRISGTLFTGTITNVTATALTITWDILTPSNSSGDPYKIYGKEHSLNSENIISRAIIGFFNENNTGGLVDMKTAISYPILEFAPFMGNNSGRLQMEETPDDFNFEEITNIKQIENVNGTSNNFDNSDGFKRFSLSAKFTSYPTKFLDDLLTLQSWNTEGWNIVLRPFIKELPPVMIGNIRITNINHNLVDTDFIDFSLEFEEV